jgi:hypothetical protein
LSVEGFPTFQQTLQLPSSGCAMMTEKNFDKYHLNTISTKTQHLGMTVNPFSLVADGLVLVLFNNTFFNCFGYIASNDRMK